MKIQKLALLTFLGVVILAVFVMVPLSTPKNSSPEITASQTPTISPVIVGDESEDDLSVTTPCVPDYDAADRLYSDDKTKYVMFDFRCNQHLEVYESTGFMLYSVDLLDEMKDIINFSAEFVSDDGNSVLVASHGDESGYYDFWQYQKDTASWMHFQKPPGAMDDYRYYPDQQRLILIQNWDSYSAYTMDYCDHAQDYDLYFIDTKINAFYAFEHEDRYISFLDLSPDGNWYTLLAGSFQPLCQGDLTDIEYWLIPFPHDRSDQNAKQLSSAPAAWLDSSTLKLKDGTIVSF